MFDYTTFIQTYIWTPDANKVPFHWKCCLCGTITDITDMDIAKTYECSNPFCKVKLKFVMSAI